MQKGDWVTLAKGKPNSKEEWQNIDWVGEVITMREDGKSIVRFHFSCDPQDLEVIS